MGIFNDLEDHSHDTRDVRGYVAGLPGPRGFTGPEGPRGEKGEAGLTTEDVAKQINEWIDYPSPITHITNFSYVDLPEKNGEMYIKLTSSNYKIGLLPMNRNKRDAMMTYLLRTNYVANVLGYFESDYSLRMDLLQTDGDYDCTIFFDFYPWHKNIDKTKFEIISTAGVTQKGQPTTKNMGTFYRIRFSLSITRVSGSTYVKTKFVITYASKPGDLATCYLSPYGTYGIVSHDIPNPSNKVFQNNIFLFSSSSTNTVVSFQNPPMILWDDYDKLHYASILDGSHVPNERRVRTIIGKEMKSLLIPNEGKVRTIIGEEIGSKLIPDEARVRTIVREELKGWFEKEYMRLLPFPGSADKPKSWKTITLTRSKPPDLPLIQDSDNSYGTLIPDDLSDFTKARLRHPDSLFGIVDKQGIDHIALRTNKRFHISIDVTGINKNVPPGKAIPSGIYGDRIDSVGIWLILQKSSTRGSPLAISANQIERGGTPPNFSYQTHPNPSSSIFVGLPDNPPFLAILIYYNYDKCTVKITYD